MPRLKGTPKPTVPNRDTMIANIMKIPNTKHKALIAFLYLSACRIGEVVGRRRRKWGLLDGAEQRYLVLPLLRSQLEKRTHTNGDTYLIAFNVPILKRKDAGVKNIPFNPKTEPDLCNAITTYADTVPAEQPLWEYHQDYACQLVKKYLGKEYFTHFLRHCRITRLATDNNFNTNDLISFVGWKDPRASSIYAHLSWEDTAKKI